MYGAMWSEHCSYKSSKIHLRTLPTEGSAVLVGPGQDAGAVDVGDGVAAVFKMESHSHPSAIEPYQGAATGVGGIVRDIISMGARPVALLDPLMFGPLDRGAEPLAARRGGRGDRRVRQLHRRPDRRRRDPLRRTALGEPEHQRACASGIAPADGLMTSASHTRARGLARGPVRRVDRARRDRRRIGARSAPRSRTGAEGSRPSVQIGDPFAGKLLIEASLEMIEAGPVGRAAGPGRRRASRARSANRPRAPAWEPTRPRRRAASGARAGGVRDPHVGVAGADARGRRTRRLADVRAVCEKWGLASAVIATLVPGGDAHDPARRRDRRAASRRSRSPTTAREYDRPAGARRVAETVDDPRSSRSRAISTRRWSPCSRRRTSPQAVGLRAVRLARPGTDRRGGRIRRRRRSGSPGR